MKLKRKSKSIKMMATLFSLLLITSIFSITGTTLVSATEINSKEQISAIDDVIKNDKWIEMEKEAAVIDFQSKGLLSSEAKATYLMNKYDGAVATTRKGGVSQRIQNGGWNVYYKTSNGKQTARTAYNGMFVAWSGNAGASGVAAAWATATGIGWIAGVIFGAIGGANAYLASLSKTCRDQIDSHGNTGTARMTLTEARWSANYDNRW
ncbi:TPA: hypothetical protein QFK26_002392 [Enterococcus faecium]|uniref:hypothetical protein n=2 Tax=Enterococcus TaxID=1350 RepID=UPI00111D51A4|nr:hypothetical protein [Enterococcus faecium]EGP4999162.1 hypothetical protein [Enterococcus faecium]EME8130118.1 hypothetical protein [Enterococcus faecium]QDB89668.1 hypothetical protein FHK65_02675 [Enterococcus faecium]